MWVIYFSTQHYKKPQFHDLPKNFLSPSLENGITTLSLLLEDLVPLETIKKYKAL
jgi:hypothetical protein